MTEQEIQNGLRRLARETRPEKPLPSAEQLWWRAEVIRRLVARDEVVRKAERPLLWSQIAGLLLVLAGLLFSLASPELRFLVASFGLMPLAVLLALFLLRTET
jgi:hypothetical protein